MLFEDLAIGTYAHWYAVYGNCVLIRKTLGNDTTAGVLVYYHILMLIKISFTNAWPKTLKPYNKNPCVSK